MTAPDLRPELRPELRTRLTQLFEEGRTLFEKFDAEVRRHDWHPFMPADYELVLRALLPLREPGLRFLETGSATGVIAIMADLLGFDAYGIELDPTLVETARDLARRYDSGARFAAGSFLPAGYEWRSSTGDSRLGTIGTGTAAYAELGHELAAFDLVYAYPWGGEDAMIMDLMQQCGRRDARLLLHGGSRGVMIYRNGLLIGRGGGRAADDPDPRDG